ncbi:MAG: hypothetical protein WCX90_01225 [Thiohalomonadaceae bacterium]
MPLRSMAMVAIFWLTGCAITDTSTKTPVFLHEVPAGTLLALERTVNFAPDSMRVYFQNGEVYSQPGILILQGVNRYRPYCVLVLRDKSATERKLTPRQYRLDRVNWDVSYMVMDVSEFRTEWLITGEDPEPHSFVCYKRGNAAYEQALSLKEIDRTVGSYFKLVKPNGE